MQKTLDKAAAPAVLELILYLIYVSCDIDGILDGT